MSPRKNDQDKQSESDRQMIDELEKLLNADDLSQLLGQAQTGAANQACPQQDDAAPPKLAPKFTPELKAELQQMLEKLRDADVPFMLSVLTVLEQESDRVQYGLQNYAWSPIPICEFKAMEQILKLPHDFSHLVLDIADKLQEVLLFQKFSDVLRKLFGQDEDGDDEQA